MKHLICASAIVTYSYELWDDIASVSDNEIDYSYLYTS